MELTQQTTIMESSDFERYGNALRHYEYQIKQDTPRSFNENYVKTSIKSADVVFNTRCSQ